ncbi:MULTISPECIES: hypothetical protein [unclassified Acinetobacter]|uniref:hypothetical protein n=1 Tax=unclassified Acinetobacter TaxID=196816 RepID=UPI0015D20B5B|nr:MULTISPECIES: hypothetical protein [unclassified Acinetobacter]
MSDPFEQIRKEMANKQNAITNCKKNEVLLELASKPIPNSYMYMWGYPHGSPHTAVKVPLYRLHMYTKDKKGYYFKVCRFGPRCVIDKKGNTILSVAGLADQQVHKLTWYKEYILHSTDKAENGAWIVTGNFLIHDGPDTCSMDDMYGTAGCLEVFGHKGFSVFNQKMLELSGESELKKVKAKITYHKAVRPKIKDYNIYDTRTGELYNRGIL